MVNASCKISNKLITELMTIDEQIAFIKKGAVDFIREEDLRKKLERSAKTGKPSAAKRMASKEENLGHLLRALDLLYDSWAIVLSPEDLDKRTWGWYVKVRPEVEHGVAGWGGKNEIKLKDILDLRRGE